LNNLAYLRSVDPDNYIPEWLEGCMGTRSLGGAVDAMMVARGKADFWVELSANPWDIAAPRLILEEAGAIFCGLNGEPTIYTGGALSCTPLLKPKLTALAERLYVQTAR
jgi:fructose-1,6-bisphosphatase/inositol monophosphatase family enzyme